MPDEVPISTTTPVTQPKRFILKRANELAYGDESRFKVRYDQELNATQLEAVKHVNGSASDIMPISIPVRILLYAFWVVFSLDYHPTLLIDVIVTALLLIAYASAVYVNHLALIPRLFRTHNYFGYFSALIAANAVLTLIVLFGIRWTYFSLWDPNQIGDYWQHYGIDLFGMIVHVAAAALLLWIVTRVKIRNRSNASNAL